jgi:aminoglycoside 3-N-acetyltransferase
MTQITQQEVIQALRTISLKEGDIAFLHSDLRIFGFPEGTTSRHEILEFYYLCFKKVIGQAGTLAVPAYFYEYARYGTTFEIESSPVSAPLGVFSNFVNHLPGRVRSANPLQSIAAIGQQAQDLCGNLSLSGYGVTSPWHQLRMLGGKIVFLGVSLQPMTYVHYIEQQYGVPHLYFKIYSTPVTKNGQKIERRPISAVRYLDYGIQYDLHDFQQILKDEGALRITPLGRGQVMAVDAEDAFQIGIRLLDQNPYCFLKHPPAFIEGKIPMDGTTGNPR